MLVQHIHYKVELNKFQFKYKYKVEVIPSASKPVAISSQQAFLACLFLKSGCALSYKSGYCSTYSKR